MYISSFCFLRLRLIGVALKGTGMIQWKSFVCHLRFAITWIFSESDHNMDFVVITRTVFTLYNSNEDKFVIILFWNSKGKVKFPFLS